MNDGVAAGAGSGAKASQSPDDRLNKASMVTEIPIALNRRHPAIQHKNAETIAITRAWGTRRLAGSVIVIQRPIPPNIKMKHARIIMASGIPRNKMDRNTVINW
jgi:hypothetical protein